MLRRLAKCIQLDASSFFGFCPFPLHHLYAFGKCSSSFLVAAQRFQTASNSLGCSVLLGCFRKTGSNFLTMSPLNWLTWDSAGRAIQTIKVTWHWKPGNERTPPAPTVPKAGRLQELWLHSRDAPSRSGCVDSHSVWSIQFLHKFIYKMYFIW